MKKILSPLYVQVFLAIVLGALLGHFDPDFGPSLQPLGLAFIKLVKMLIGPIIFTTVVAGIGSMGDLKAVGRVGIKALVYFEGMTTFALLLGMVVINLVRPGVGIHATAATLGASGTVPVAGIALILGVDTFMSQARAITNFIGNAVATLVVSRWEDAIDPVAARCVLVSPPELPAVQPAV